MIFGPQPVRAALGAILAHSVAAGGVRLRKGQVLGAEDVAALAAAGVEEVMVARLGPDDVGEDPAAARLARALAPDPAAAGLIVGEAFTGRVNLKAAHPGIVELDRAAVGRLNRIDPAITVATLPPLARVAAGDLVVTVKIITYGVADVLLSRAESVAAHALRIRPVVVGAAALIRTEVPGQDPKLAQKGRRAVEARLRALGIRLARCVTVAHAPGALAAALAETGEEMILILTGSATSDARDTGPAALALAGGRLARFGMPVDPGNLLFLGELGGRPVIGLPGCARSPALNGADWVLERLACGLAVGDDDIAEMGVGGLLKEGPRRPQPREASAPETG